MMIDDAYTGATHYGMVFSSVISNFHLENREPAFRRPEQRSPSSSTATGQFRILSSVLAIVYA